MAHTLFETDLPIVAAPMAGGPSNPALARAVSEAGGFPFLAGGYQDPDALRSEIQFTRDSVAEFGVNLFVPNNIDCDRAAFAEYADALRPIAAQFDVELDPHPVLEDRDQWEAKLELLISDPVPVVSLTFGLPTAAEIAALQRAGSRVLSTVTTPDEAVRAASRNVDGLVVQGATAGGHSGVHHPHRTPSRWQALDLVQAITTYIDLPLIAAGGVANADDVARLLRAGAEAVQVGTLLIRTEQSGASQTHKDALADERFDETAVTAAFTGRPARALRNTFLDRFSEWAPIGYPAVHYLTHPIRKAAARAGDPQWLHLWAGTGFRSATTDSATDVITRLADRM